MIRWVVPKRLDRQIRIKAIKKEETLQSLIAEVLENGLKGKGKICQKGSYGKIGKERKIAEEV